MAKRYRPSNGTEGCCFIETYCMNCIHEKFSHTYNDDDKKCDILSRTMIYEINEKEYPEEWQYDENNRPCCTAFKKWDWGNDGDPNDPDNPKYQPPDNPNQLCFPFIFDEIGISQNKLIMQEN